MLGWIYGRSDDSPGASGCLLGAVSFVVAVVVVVGELALRRGRISFAVNIYHHNWFVWIDNYAPEF